MSKQYVAKSNILGGQGWETGAIVAGDDPYIKDNYDRLTDQGAIAEATDADKETAGYVSPEDQAEAKEEAEDLDLPEEATPVMTTGSMAPGVGTTPPGDHAETKAFADDANNNKKKAWGK